MKLPRTIAVLGCNLVDASFPILNYKGSKSKVAVSIGHAWLIICDRSCVAKAAIFLYKCNILLFSLWVGFLWEGKNLTTLCLCTWSITDWRFLELAAAFPRAMIYQPTSLPSYFPFSTHNCWNDLSPPINEQITNRNPLEVQLWALILSL